MIPIFIFEGSLGISEDQKAQAYYTIDEWTKEGAIALLNEVYGDSDLTDKVWADRIHQGGTEYDGQTLGSTVHVLSGNLIEAVADADAFGHVYIVRV